MCSSTLNQRKLGRATILETQMTTEPSPEVAGRKVALKKYAWRSEGQRRIGRSRPGRAAEGASRPGTEALPSLRIHEASAFKEPCKVCVEGSEDHGTVSVMSWNGDFG